MCGENCPRNGDWRFVSPLRECCQSLCFVWPKAARLMLCAPLHPRSGTLRLFHFFPKLKLVLKGRRFDDIIMIQKQSQATYAEFKTHDFCKYFQQWREIWTLYQIPSVRHGIADK
jgi:hypothetical protein